ncbi:MAG: TIR domain-containing protein [Planctomycetota bacterium]|nr:TIR domain-containing protein [Planctomycetota bacterium]MDA0918001.1 TIR domain-containing protein [Planctomycetota bacterium]
MSDEPVHPIIFISYSHDSPEHRERVLAFSERLRQDGFDTRLDRYINGTPPKGWERWMMDGLDEAAFVLVVCTETYYRRFRGHEEPGVGKGVDWEGALITQAIYKARSDTAKFVPVMFDAADSQFVPEPMGSHTHYVLDSESRYADLCDFLDGVAGVEPGEVGTRTPKDRPRGAALTFETAASAGTGSAVGTPTQQVMDREIAPSRILRHAPQVLFGREPWLDVLGAAWEKRASTHVCTLVAWGGVGKTSLVAHWVQQRFAAQNWPGVERYFDWSFYSQGTGESRQTSSDLFISRALTFFGDADPTVGGPWERGERLARLVRKRRTLLVLDGVEPLQYPEGDSSGQGGMLKDEGLAALLQGLAADNPGLCVVTTRETLANLRVFNDSTSPEHRLDELPCDAAVDLLRHLLADSSFPNNDEDLRATWKDAGGHALTLQLLGRYLADAHGGDIRKRDLVGLQEVTAKLRAARHSKSWPRTNAG